MENSKVTIFGLFLKNRPYPSDPARTVSYHIKVKNRPVLSQIIPDLKTGLKFVNNNKRYKVVFKYSIVIVMLTVSA